MFLSELLTVFTEEIALRFSYLQSVEYLLYRDGHSVRDATSLGQPFEITAVPYLPRVIP